MTDDERRNRNPAVEVFPMSTEQLLACREMRAGELQLHHVYIIQSSPGHVFTFNYMGGCFALHPRTLQMVYVHVFAGPRIKTEYIFMEMPDGTLQDCDGNKMTIREYSGPDAF